MRRLRSVGRRYSQHWVTGSGGYMRLVRLGAVPLGECFRFGASPRDHNYMRVTPRGKLSSSYLLLRQEGDAPFGFPGLSLELFSLPSAVVVHPVRVGFRVMVHGVGVEVGNIPCLARTVVSIPRFEGSTLALLLRGGDGGEIGEAESRRFGFGTLVHRRYALDLVTGEETFSLGASAQVVPVKLGFRPRSFAAWATIPVARSSRMWVLLTT